jgi:rubrerythrin
MRTELDALTDEERQVISQIWYRRAEGERSASETFRVVAAGLTALDAEPELSALARRAVDDEQRHADRCWQLACIYAGRLLPEAAPRPGELPRYDGASDELRHSLHVVGQCCLNETTASAFLERCLQATKAPAARATFRVLLSDEIDHARIGWAHLASPRLSTATRAAIAAWLPSMIAANLRAWHARPDVPTAPVYAAHGVLPLASTNQAVDAAVDDLILPGLRHVGIDVATCSWREEPEAPLRHHP